MTIFTENRTWVFRGNHHSRNRVNSSLQVAGGSHVWAKRSEQLTRAYLTQSVLKIILQELTPTQIRQLILYISSSKG